MIYNETKITVPIYGNVLTFIFTDSPEEVTSRHGVPKEDVEGCDACTCFKQGGTDENPKTKLMVVLRADEELNVGILSHECVHATHYIMSCKGMHANLYDDEAEAYLHGWIMNQLYDFWEEGKKLFGEK